MKPTTIQSAQWKKLLRFLTGGGFATLLHWMVMFLLIRSGTDARLATAIGATAGLAANYIAQYHYTFRCVLPHRVALSRYLASASLGWGVNLAAFSAMYATTGATMTSQIVSTMTATFANYLLAEKFVFQEEQTNDTH